MAKVRIGPSTSQEAVKLYDVYNTAHRSLLVIAPNERTAEEIAHGANHVYNLGSFRKDQDYPHVVRDLFSRRELAGHTDSIQAAIAQRLQGTVHLEGKHVCVGYQALQ